MKRTDIYRIYPLAAALLLAGCMVEESDGSRADVPVMLTATVLETGHGPMATRAGVDVQSTQLPNGATFRAEFSGSDVTETTATYTADGTGGATASPQPYFTLTGTSTTVSAYHGKSGGTGGTQVTGATTSFTVASDQTGDAAYQASDLMYATATVQKSNPVGALTFSHKMAKIIVNATLGDGISSISAVKIIGGLPTVALSGTDCTVGAASGTAFSTSNPLTVHSGTHSSGTLSCAALIPPQTVSGNFLVVTTDQGDVTYSLDSKVFATGQSYTFNITVNLAAVGTTVAITNWSNNGNATVNPTVVNEVYRQAVDLGLSVKWANMNVGASSPTDYGLYFMWGDVAGHPGAKTDGFSFNWENYKWCNDTSTPKFTKYVPTGKTANWGGSGSPDNKLTLDAADDAATACWGSGWRMPTKTEMEELVNNTDQEWTTINSVAGRKFMKKSDHSVYIFLPAAGYRGNASFYDQRSRGYYWSSTLDTGTPDYAWNLYFYSSYAGVSISYRCLGFAVRAVQSN